MMRAESSTRRNGVTLVEVLTAIFVMALGLMALLTLFPLGALTMAQAIKDDRTGTAARSGEGVARTAWKVAVSLNGSTNPDPILTAAMLDPDGAGGPLPSKGTPGTTGPSYPVFVDPFGVSQYASLTIPGNNWRDWLRGRDSSVPRRSLSVIANAPPVLQGPAITSFFSSGDDLSFAENGLPTNPPIERQRRYSWAYLIRTIDVRFPTELDLTVVVYSGRSMQLTSDLVPQGEEIYSAEFLSGQTKATIAWGAGGVAPSVRPGGWVMDGTMNVNPPRGYFYRVVNVNQTSATTLELELQTPARAGGAGFNSQAIFLDNVVEVFEKGTVLP